MKCCYICLSNKKIMGKNKLDTVVKKINFYHLFLKYFLLMNFNKNKF